MASRARWSTQGALVVGLLAAISCNGGPTRPTQEEQFAIYAGRWSGTIGGLAVVLDIQAERGFASPSLSGTGTAVDGATNETHQLTVDGIGVMPGFTAPAALNVREAHQVAPNGQITKWGEPMGQLTGNVSQDRRTWSMQFQPPSSTHYPVIFGRAEHAVTLVRH